jgi:hypothetical protein
MDTASAIDKALEIGTASSNQRIRTGLNKKPKRVTELSVAQLN